MDKSTETQPQHYEERSTLRIYNWVQKKIGRKRVYRTGLESVSLESLLTSHDGTSLED
jgi:hypothetical protein